MKKVIVILCFFPAFLFGQSKSDQKETKLVVGIVVDQMKQTYLSKFWDNFGEGGFKRLYQDGFVFQNNHYNYKPTYTAPGHASIFTGTTPSVHGIVANNWYSREEQQNVYCVETTDETGKLQKTPKRLKVNTISDVMKLYSDFQSKVYTVALKDRAAILPAGFLADGAYWFDGENGKWRGSRHYSQKNPQWLNAFNTQDLSTIYLNGKWSLNLSKARYHSSLDDQNKYEAELFKGSRSAFPYNLKHGLEVKSHDLFKRIPAGNQMTIDLANKIIETEKLGKNEAVDFLSISFSATDYIGHLFGTTSLELEDAYIKLDRSIAGFLNHLDQTVGKNNYLLFLTSDHGAGLPPLYLKNKGVSAGIIDVKVMKNELENILDQKFGDAVWIEAFKNFNLYLNHQTILEKNVAIDQVLEVATIYLLAQEGVADVYHKNRKVKNEKYQNMILKGFYPKNSGDLIILEQPNYNAAYSTGSTHGSPYAYDTGVPLIFFGNKIKSGSSHRLCSPTDIAPTLSALLNLPLTDGSNGKVLFEVLTK